MIHLRLKQKGFRGSSTPVLRDVQLNLMPGSFTAIVGPSGAGKTTLLRIVAGLDHEYDGDLDCDAQFLRTAFLFQDARLMPWLTAARNVALACEGDRGRATAALHSVGLAEVADSFPNQLSGGMQRRVAMARALVHEPQLLLLDEPFASLDEPAVREMHALLRSYCQQHQPIVVLVSHNLDEALALSDKLLFLGESPSTIIHTFTVPFSDDLDFASETVLHTRQRLLDKLPKLLEGVIDT
ncbi:MAG: ABC transporter ATP-binding protein [Pseudomonadota bacterium]